MGIHVCSCHSVCVFMHMYTRIWYKAWTLQLDVRTAHGQSASTSRTPKKHVLYIKENDK